MKVNKKYKLILVAIFLLAVTAFLYDKYQHNASGHGKHQELALRVIKLNESEWGYEIYQGERLFIRQQQIPCVQGVSGFRSRKDAEMVGVLVIDKLCKGKLPAVSMEELKQLGIVY